MSVALLLASAAVAAGSAIASASKNAQARGEERRAYNRNRLALQADRYRSPLSSLTNRTLLKGMEERLRDENEAADNRAAAGGYTVENRLAAKEGANRIISNTYGQLLSGEDARQMAIRNQQMALDNQHSQNVANYHRADAQNWQQWGQATAQAIMAYGMADYLSQHQPLTAPSAGAATGAATSTAPAPAVKPMPGWDPAATYKSVYGPDANGLYHT